MWCSFPSAVGGCCTRVLYEQLRQHLGEVLRRLAMQKESRIEEGHLMPDHVHMMIAIPPKYAVSQVIGYIKGKSAMQLARVYGERKRNFVGQHFWARGYFVSTVGRDEATIREYIRNQEQEDRRLDQMNLKPPALPGDTYWDPIHRSFPNWRTYYEILEHPPRSLSCAHPNRGDPIPDRDRRCGALLCECQE
jgi:putative transposase